MSIQRKKHEITFTGRGMHVRQKSDAPRTKAKGDKEPKVDAATKAEFKNLVSRFMAWLKKYDTLRDEFDKLIEDAGDLDDNGLATLYNDSSSISLLDQINAALREADGESAIEIGNLKEFIPDTFERLDDGGFAGLDTQEEEAPDFSEEIKLVERARASAIKLQSAKRKSAFISSADASLKDSRDAMESLIEKGADHASGGGRAPSDLDDADDGTFAQWVDSITNDTLTSIENLFDNTSIALRNNTPSQAQRRMDASVENLADIIFMLEAAKEKAQEFDE